ncbi:MAG TPA: hypothetical protein IAA78_06050 [Candidatus Avamphibacillus intestinigallinarum]|nr:hypothetical protein [Candidatus Avamphibacillus intestinigallinarum]
MQVQVFTAITETGLTRKMNRFLNESSVEVIDIKFSSTIFFLSGLIMYKS